MTGREIQRRNGLVKGRAWKMRDGNGDSSILSAITMAEDLTAVKWQVTLEKSPAILFWHSSGFLSMNWKIGRLK
eukprot:753319-Hanusia_phi.AAC.1